VRRALLVAADIEPDLPSCDDGQLGRQGRAPAWRGNEAPPTALPRRAGADAGPDLASQMDDFDNSRALGAASVAGVVEIVASGYEISDDEGHCVSAVGFAAFAAGRLGAHYLPEHWRASGLARFSPCWEAQFRRSENPCLRPPPHRCATAFGAAASHRRAIRNCCRILSELAAFCGLRRGRRSDAAARMSWEHRGSVNQSVMTRDGFRASRFACDSRTRFAHGQGLSVWVTAQFRKTGLRA
jgi:hypothetical protein